MTCNYCKKPGHIVNDCRKLKYNNKQKSKSGEESSASAVIKMIGDLKENAIFMFKSELNKNIINLSNNQIIMEKL